MDKQDANNIMDLFFPKQNEIYVACQNTMLEHSMEKPVARDTFRRGWYTCITWMRRRWVENEIIAQLYIGLQEARVKIKDLEALQKILIDENLRLSAQVEVLKEGKS